MVGFILVFRGFWCKVSKSIFVTFLLLLLFILFVVTNIRVSSFIHPTIKMMLVDVALVYLLLNLSRYIHTGRVNLASFWCLYCYCQPVKYAENINIQSQQ